MPDKNDLEVLGQVVPPPSAEQIIEAASKFPPVAPRVHAENYQYTVFFPSGAVEVTASERTVADLWKRIVAAVPFIADGEPVRTGVVHFPEAVVKAALVEAVIAGWEDDGGEDDEEEEEDPAPPTRRLKKARPF